MKTRNLLDQLRAGPWLLLAVITAAVVGVLSPSHLGMLAWSLAKVSLGAWLGYRIDRGLFPYGRPHEVAPEVFAMAMLRRSVVVAAVVIALGLGI